MKKINTIILVAAIATASCKKDTAKAENEICTIATIKYGGDPAADGVGWYISIPDSSGGKREYPQNLPAIFKVNNLLVNVCYIKTDKDFVCFCVLPLPKMVNINSIVKN